MNMSDLEPDIFLRQGRRRRVDNVLEALRNSQRILAVTVPISG